MACHGPSKGCRLCKSRKVKVWIWTAVCFVVRGGCSFLSISVMNRNLAVNDVQNMGGLVLATTLFETKTASSNGVSRFGQEKKNQAIAE